MRFGPLGVRTRPLCGRNMRAAHRIIGEQFPAPHRCKRRDLNLIFQSRVLKHQIRPLSHVNRVAVAD